ncbi:MAG TPA: GNAT family N-acetyltransferase [Anaerolineae bacterium]|nr:GNAT family N-acetyltransferase [Anaerolineae bacterium]
MRTVQVSVREEGIGSLSDYATVPIAFTVHSVLVPVLLDGGLGGIVLREEPVDPPVVKDYDAYEDGPPTAWGREFDMARWGFLIARDPQGQPIGAAAIAFDTPGVNMLEGRRDLAVLWDIRVHPAHRGSGLGARLFREAAAWARARACTQLKVETQNVNVPACRFYAAQGCRLGAIHRYAYAAQPHVADEVMLLWYLDL